MRTSKSIDYQLSSLVERINDNIYYRKIYHLVGGSLMIVGLILLDREWFISLCVLFILAFYLISKRITFAVIGVVLLFVLSNSIFITLSATTIWVVGDGLAGLVGALYGKRKWPWHAQKTILGSVSFLAGSFLALSVVLICMIDAPLYILIPLALLPSLGACMVEILPITLIKDRKVDDNLLVILSGALFIHLLSVWLGV